jgi:DNA gyrase subunit B
LIERGHVFIAQPPLYKVKKGKQERYVKDDAELDAYILQLALDGAQLFVNPQAPAIDEGVLERLAKDHTALMLRWDRRSRQFPRAITKRLVDLPIVDAGMLGDELAMKDWSERLQSAIGMIDGDMPTVTVELDREHQVYLPVVQMRVRGITEQVRLSHNFFMSPEYRAVAALGEHVFGLLEEGAYAQRGEKTKTVQTFGEVLDWFVAEARRGLDVQRYKGLGEMNPDQLWQTTMDPSVRRMLRVNVDDAIAADQMFTTLMGDQVEPRRAFIESNALSVVNLDV